MSNPDAYVREINSIDQELKRTNARLKILRKQKRDKQALLYKYMIKNNLDSYKGKTLSSVRPRDHYTRKSETQKKQESIVLFREAGIENPEEFYLEYKERLKGKPNEEEEGSGASKKNVKRTSKKKDKNEYDPYLGF